jgi:transcriptional regulator with XRE-family HTH domain
MEKTSVPAHVTTLGAAVRYLREARSLTLRELARRVGVSAPFLSDIEHNRRSTERLKELAQALDVAPEELARFDTRLAPELREWVASTPGMPDLLRELKESGLTTYQLRSALLRPKR